MHFRNLYHKVNFDFDEVNKFQCWNEHQFLEHRVSSSNNIPSMNEQMPSRSMLNPTLCWNEHQFFEHQSSSSTNFLSEHERPSSYSMLDPALKISIQTLCKSALKILLYTFSHCSIVHRKLKFNSHKQFRNQIK